MEMMLEWREGLEGLKDRQVEAIAEAFNEKACYIAALDDQGRAEIKKWLTKYAL